MKSSVRAFVAIETSAAVRQRATELIGILAASEAKVSWVKPQNLHLTVKFLDEVPLDSIPKVSAAVQKAVAGLEPFELEIRAAGAFPSTSRPRTLWLGTGQGSESLGRLHMALESALHKVGYPREHRRFAAHLTLGRVRELGPGLEQLAPLVNRHADFAAGRFPVVELLVFSSQLTPQGPIYEVLSRAALGNPE
jgi:RNA 2',3'-cyclic 3'-phosphodiesterase